MAEIKLNFLKLFGFKLIAKDLAGASRDGHVSPKIGVKVGEKVGMKTNRVPGH